MKLHRGCDVLPDRTGLVCRQSRIGGAIQTLIFGAAFGGSPILQWWLGAPLVFPIIFALVAVIIVPLLLGDARARFRTTNWVLWIRPRGLWINLRSYQDRSSQETLSVVELTDSEIEHVQRRTERYTAPTMSGSTVSYKLESLDIKLHESDTGQLAAALAACRRAKQPWTKQLGFMTSKSGVTLYSVSLPAADRIRIAWWGGRGHGITPSLRRVLEKLEYRMSVAEPTDDKRPDWREIPDAQLDDEILSLVGAGNRIDAIKLLENRRDMSTTEAHQFIEELAGRV